jgi:heterodisulfide reductase subunit C
MQTAQLDSVPGRIKEITSQHVSQCYQCGKCSAGCPVRDNLSMPPNRVVRLVQLGMYKEALSSSTIWMCAGCQTCSSRCPKNFDLAKFMDAMRQISIEENIKPADPKIRKFHSAFLKQIKSHGRSYELGMLINYKLATGDLLQDVDAAPSTLLKGKISVFPHNIKDRNAINKIIDKLPGQDKK